jgi:hypothetical protein
MPVDDAYGLETTLSRLRQRYALYFYLPAGVKPGEERSITVDLADAANRRYPGAEVRYRRVYLSPGGSSSDSTVISRRQGAPGPETSSTSGATDSTAPRRRVAVSDASNDGPRVSIGAGDPPPAAAQSQPAAASPTRAPAAAATPAAAPAPAAPATPRRGWRRVTGPDDPNGPITPADPKSSDSTKSSKPDGQQ